MYVQQILAQISICDLICCLYILFEPVYNILPNKIQIWTFDSDNKVNLLREFNHVLRFFILTDPKLDSNYFTKYFQDLASRKIVLCLRCEWPL